MQIELKGIFSIELNEPSLPADPACCCVLMFADIGVRDSAGADQFNFHVVTPNFLVAYPEVRWGHAYLLMPEFDWNEAKRMLERLVAGVRADRWEEATTQLCKFLEWEFDGYH
jgi:hypothetical protein